MPSSSTTTTSNSNSTSVSPWGPVQAPLQKVIDQTEPLIGDNNFFKPPQQQAHTDGVAALKSYATSGNNGNDIFNQPLNSQTQFQPVMAGAQYDANQGATAMHGYMGRRDQGFDQGRADQWNQHRDAYLGDGSNPYLDQVIQDSSNDIMSQIKGQFSNAGRSLGSGAFAGVAADRIGQMATQMRFSDYNNRYNQERANFENQANANDAYGFNAANNLYGSGTNTILNAAPTLDNLNTTRIGQREQVLGDRANSLLRAGDVENQLYRDQNITPTLESLSYPMQLLQAPATNFRNGTTTATQAQQTPNTGLLGGLAQTGLGLLGGFF